MISHGGEEFTSLTSPYTRDRYLKFLEMGAEVFIGHHPYVAENYERFDDGKMIFMDSKRFTNASEEVWNAYFYSDEPEGYVKRKT